MIQELCVHWDFLANIGNPETCVIVTIGNNDNLKDTLGTFKL